MGGSHETTHNTDADLDYSSRDIGIAFALTIFAGLTTVLGGAIVFCLNSSNQNQKFNPRLLLSSGLSIAAGSIIYISFADLLPEGTEFFATDAGSEQEEQLSTLWATLCLFSGVVLMAGMSWLTHKLSPHHHHHHHDSHHHHGHGHGDDLVSTHSIHNSNQNKTATENKIAADADSTTSPDGDDATDEENASNLRNTDATNPSTNDKEQQQQYTLDGDEEKEEQVVDNINGDDSISDDEKATLCQSGISTTVALVLHSFPEGLVTFITTAQDPTIGAALAIGIAIHNVVEGMSIAMQIYFATQQKRKAFATVACAGLSPMVGGLVGYAILESADFSNTVFGIMFGIAAGMLIYIAIKDLLKTAYKYDPHDKVTTIGFFVGMALIALALVILESTGNHNHAVTMGGHGSHGHGNEQELFTENNHDTMYQEEEEVAAISEDHDDNHHHAGGDDDGHHHY